MINFAGFAIASFNFCLARKYTLHVSERMEDHLSETNSLEIIQSSYLGVKEVNAFCFHACIYTWQAPEQYSLCKIVFFLSSYGLS